MLVAGQDGSIRVSESRFVDGSKDSMVSAAVAGDEHALTTILNRFGVVIRDALSISPKWRSSLDPDDVMQVTYMEAYLQIHKLKTATEEGFVSWLRRIAENNLRDAIRSLECDKRPQNRVESVPGDDSYTTLLNQLSAGSTTPSRAAGRREIQQFVEDALKKLPADYEKVIRFCMLEGKSRRKRLRTWGFVMAPPGCDWPGPRTTCANCSNPDPTSTVTPRDSRNRDYA